MNPRERLFLICYDITEPHRLNRIARFLSQHACRVQYSVFAGQLSRTHLEALLEELSHLMDSRTDDVRAYPLPRQAHVDLLGIQLFPADVLLIHNGHNLLRLNAGSDQHKKHHLSSAHEPGITNSSLIIS